MLGLELDTNLRLSIIKKEDRSLKKNEVRVRVISCGICGTDNHIIKGESRASLPVILGHEFGGAIEEVGNGVSSLRTGDTVAIDPNIPCHSCEYCRDGSIHLCKNLLAIGVDVDGGMSDTCIVPEEQAYKLSSSFDPIELPFVEPLSCVLHGLERVNVKHGERVLVIGAGTVGLMFVMLLKDTAGELVVDEPISSRLKKAIAMGGTDDKSGRAEYFDAVIECSGTITGFEKAIRRIKRGGKILVFGVSPQSSRFYMSPNEIYSKEMSILGSYVNPYTFVRAINIINNKKISLSSFDLKAFALENYKAAFDASQSGEYSKVVFRFEGSN
jgi:threonine dehydrogenase-like Zn-dependent dehydrogenase